MDRDVCGWLTLWPEKDEETSQDGGKSVCISGNCVGPRDGPGEPRGKEDTAPKW
jgi:hypothetical protein